ncbi:transposase [Arthrobacter sp. lap29]|uniref:transposase n=1 Tax=Arthrobacter sp. lap29 TaxID=3056122 RepID=UPI0028F6FAED|nr:transposase [Arthrobacter sp. lap29]
MDEELRRRAVSAVLDGGMTRVAVCKQHGISKYHLRIWVQQEKDRREGSTDESIIRAQEATEEGFNGEETTESRLRRLAAEWGEPERYVARIQSGLRKAKQTKNWVRYGVCWPLWLVAGLLYVLLIFIILAVVLSRCNSTVNALQCVGLFSVGGLVFVIVHVSIWAITGYLESWVFRLIAPFAFAVTHLQGAWEQLQATDACVFHNPQSMREGMIRDQITEQIGSAASTLDATWRLGRPLGASINRGIERDSRRQVAAYVAKAEYLLWDGGIVGRLQAIEILQVGAYETILRNWTLHEFKGVKAPSSTSPKQRRKLTPKAIVSWSGVILSVAWQLFGPEDQSPFHIIREFLHSNAWFGQ